MDKGLISITRTNAGSRDTDRIKIELIGSDGKMVRVYMSVNDFGMAITGMGNLECEYVMSEGRKTNRQQ